MKTSFLLCLCLLFATPLVSGLTAISFDYTVTNGLVSCTGNYTGNLTHYCWNISSASGVLTGTTGWINYTSGPLYYSASIGESEVFEITLLGRNGTTELYRQTQFVRTVYISPEEEPEEPEYIPGESKGLLIPSSYEIPVAGVFIDIRAVAFLFVIVAFIYIVTKKRKRIRVRRD